MSLHYNIKVNKDHALVKATWDVNVDMSDTELISSFALTNRGQSSEHPMQQPDWRRQQSV